MKIFNKYARVTATIHVLNKCLGRLRNNVTFSKGLPDSNSVASVNSVSHSYACNTFSYISYIWLQYLSINKHIKLISTDSITHNFSFTDVNNNLQLSYSSWDKCHTTLLTNMKGLGCTAAEYLSDTRLS